MHQEILLKLEWIQDLVNNSTHLHSELDGERRASLDFWVNRHFFFPLQKYCFAVSLNKTDTWASDQTDVLCTAITHGHRRLGFPVTGWVTWLKHRAIRLRARAESQSRLSCSVRTVPWPSLPPLCSWSVLAEDSCGKLDSLRQIP